MYAEERQRAIAELVLRRGRMAVTELSEDFEVTTETIRRDLSALERSGVLRRVHGGAVPAGGMIETVLSERDVEHAEEKDRIAKLAVEQLGPRDSHGRSLRDFDLERRIFRYPCSYLIYSPAFDALPVAVREYVSKRLNEILSGEDQTAEFQHLSAEDRRAIREILAETKPGLLPPIASP